MYVAALETNKVFYIKEMCFSSLYFIYNDGTIDKTGKHANGDLKTCGPKLVSIYMI